MTKNKPEYFGKSIKDLSDCLDDVQPSDSYDDFSERLDAVADEYRKQLSKKKLSTASLEIFASKILAAHLKLTDEHAESLKEFARFVDFFENFVPAMDAVLAQKALDQISIVRAQIAKAGASAKLANDKDGKQAAKQNVRDCWEVWRQKPEQYKSKSAFARAMLDKYEELGSQRVIERWCKEWESEPS